MQMQNYSQWRDTAKTLHSVSQMLGKVKLERMRAQPEWQQVILPLTAQGFTTGLIPFGQHGYSLDIDVFDGLVTLRCTDGKKASFSLEEKECVSKCYSAFLEMLKELNFGTEINPIPQEMAEIIPFYDDHKARPWNRDQAVRFFEMCVFAHNAIQNFIAPFRGKKVQPQLFWGTFDVTGILFSGKEAPFDGGGIIEKVAFDEMFIEYGFWPGDDTVDGPSFFALPYLFLETDLTGKPLRTGKAVYSTAKKEYFLSLEDALSYPDPEKAVQEFFEDSFRIVTEAQGWENLDWFTKPLLTSATSR